MAEKGAFDLAAAAGCALGYDEDAGAGVGGKLGFAPEGAGGQFGLVVGDLVKVSLSGGLMESGFLPWAPGVEKGALDGQDAVKAGEQERRTVGLAGSGRGVLKERDQLEGQAGRTEQVAGAAGFVESGEPTAEGGCIVLPTGAGGRAQEFGGVGAEQFVGFHGQGGEAVARAFKDSSEPEVRRGQAGPEGLLLGRVQQQAAIERARSPGGADEAVPVQDAGRGPGGWKAEPRARAARSLAVTTRPPLRSHASS